MGRRGIQERNPGEESNGGIQERNPGGRIHEENAGGGRTAGSPKPEAESWKSEAGSRTPEAGSWKPEAKRQKPESGIQERNPAGGIQERSAGEESRRGIHGKNP